MTGQEWFVVVLFLGAGYFNQFIRRKGRRAWFFFGLAFLSMAATGKSYPDWYRWAAMGIAAICFIRSALTKNPRSKKSLEELEEEARTLRVDAGKHRMFGQFDAAYRNYRRAYELYVTLGDTDAQCNVLCSLAETTPRRDEIRGYLEQIEAVCGSMSDPDERAKALRNLDALKNRLNYS